MEFDAVAVDQACQFAGLLGGEVDELQAAEAGAGAGEGLVFGQSADVVNAAATDTRKVKAVRPGPQNVDGPACGCFTVAGCKLKGQAAFADVDQPAADLSAMAENVKRRIPDAVTGVPPLLCFHINPFRGSDFCRILA